MELLLPENLSSDQRTVFQNYGKVDQAKIKFGNYSKPSTFKFLFGDDEGVRLWEHYVMKCNRNFDQFLSFLTAPQRNIILINAVYNENIYSL